MLRVVEREYDLLTWEQKRPYVLVFLAATLCCTVLLKFAEVQYLEWIFAVDLVLLSWLTLREGAALRLYRPFYEIGKSYAIFLILAFALCLLALREEFPGARYAGLLKQPVAVTLSRSAELFLDAFYMLYLAYL